MEPLTKIDSAVQGLSSSPPKDAKARRQSSAAAPGVMNINDLGKFALSASLCSIAGFFDQAFICYVPTLTSLLERDKVEIQIAIETQKTGW